MVEGNVAVQPLFFGNVIIVGQPDAILVIRAVYVGDMDVFDRFLRCQKTDGAVTVLSENTVDLDIGDIAERALVRVERDEIVVAGALQIADHAEMTVSVKMQAVHIDRRRISEIIIEGDIFHREIRNLTEGRSEIRGVFDGQRGHFEADDFIEIYTVAPELGNGVILGLNRVGILLHIVAIPNTSRDFNIAGGLCVGIRGEKARFPGSGTFLDGNVGILLQFVFEHEAIGSGRQTDLRKARKDQLEVGRQFQRRGDQIMVLRNGQLQLSGRSVDQLLDRRGVVVNTVSVKRIHKRILRKNIKLK